MLFKETVDGARTQAHTHDGHRTKGNHNTSCSGELKSQESCPSFTQHVFGAFSTNVPNILKMFLSMLELLGCTSSISKDSLSGNNYKRKGERFINYAHITPAHPDLHPNIPLSKNLRSHRNYGAHKNVFMNGQTDRWMPG